LFLLLLSLAATQLVILPPSVLLAGDASG
jgi:hypothetical protein